MHVCIYTAGPHIFCSSTTVGNPHINPIHPSGAPCDQLSPSDAVLLTSLNDRMFSSICTFETLYQYKSTKVSTTLNDCCNVVRLRMNFLLPAQVDFFLTFPNYKIPPLSNSSNILLLLAGTTSLRLLTAEMWCDIISAHSSTIPVAQGICHVNVSVFSTGLDLDAKCIYMCNSQSYDAKYFPGPLLRVVLLCLYFRTRIYLYM